MKSILVAAFVLSQVFAQTQPDDPARPVLGKTGQIFVLKLIPGASRLEVSLAGTPAAKIEPGRLEVFGQVVKTGGAPKKLEILPAADHFQVKGAITPDEQIEIRVKDKQTKKSETLKLEQMPKP